MEFSRQEYWSDLPFPPPGDLPDPGIKPTSLASPAVGGGGIFTPVPSGKPVQHFLVTYQCWRPLLLLLLIETTIQGEVRSHGRDCEQNMGSDSLLTTHLQPQRSWKDRQEGRR